MSYGDLTKLLVALAKRECGVASGDPALEGYTTAQIGQRGNQLVADGLLFRAKFSHRCVRFYTDMARAQKAVENRKRGREMMGEKRVHKDRVSDNYYKQKLAALDMVITDKTVFTQCPNYAPRFAEIDLPKIYGGNQRGRVVPEKEQTS
jgi:hypothetical protein